MLRPCRTLPLHDCYAAVVSDTEHIVPQPSSIIPVVDAAISFCFVTFSLVIVYEVSRIKGRGPWKGVCTEEAFLFFVSGVKISVIRDAIFVLL